MKTGNELQRLTNEQFLSDLCNFSPYGAIGQMALMQCLEHGINYILEIKDEELAKYDKEVEAGKHHFVNMHSFVGAVENIRDRFQEKYNPKPVEQE